MLSSYASRAASRTKLPRIQPRSFRTDHVAEYPRSAFFMNPMVWPISQQRGAEEDLGMTATRGFSTQQEASSSGYPDGTNSASSGGAPNALGVSAGPYYARSSYYNTNCEPRNKKRGVGTTVFFPSKGLCVCRVYFYFFWSRFWFVIMCIRDLSSSSLWSCVLLTTTLLSDLAPKRMCVCVAGWRPLSSLKPHSDL